MSETKRGGGGMPPNPTNRGIMDQIRTLKVGGSLSFPAAIRQRFYSDFKRLGWRCAVRSDKADKTKVQVYRVK